MPPPDGTRDDNSRPSDERAERPEVSVGVGDRPFEAVSRDLARRARRRLLAAAVPLVVVLCLMLLAVLAVLR